MTIRTTLLGAALAAATVLPASAEELKFASFASPAHTITASVIDKLNDSLSSATNGALTVKGYFGGALGAGPAEQYVRVLQGVADIAWGLPGYTSSQFPRTMLAEMPGVIPEGVPGYVVLWKAYDQYLKGEFPGTKPLALWTAEPNILIMKEKVIRKPEDLAGLKLRVAGTTAGEAVSALGATPVQMPMNDVYNALQTGLIDGAISGYSTLSDFKLDEVASSYTFGVPLGRLTFYTVMNKAKYDSLPDDQKAAIDAIAGEPLSKSAEDAWLVTATAALDAARASGDNTIVELTPEQAKPFADAISAVTENYAKSVGAEDVLKSMRGK
ncbi:MAG: TRAP transporter substrate-binding protein [Rhodobacteraceae bacterium]|nr:TRAP transporter substrate-binding protein [Paracoccaceae bacterium]